jgi:hypothetical protein
MTAILGTSRLGCFMKSFKGIRVLVLGGVLVTLNSGVGLALQEQTAAPAQATGDHVPAAGPEKPAEPASPASSSASERQKKLAADTDKLLALATDLKKQVDKTNKDILSVEVVKKADEIEKLARSMKNDMK